MKRPSESSAPPEDSVIAPVVPERLIQLARAQPERPRPPSPALPEDLTVFLTQWVDDVLSGTLRRGAQDPGLLASATALYQGLYTLRQRAGLGSEAGRAASEDLARFLALVCDHTPETAVTLKDVAKGFLKVDVEYFSGKLRSTLVREFLTRGLLFPGDLRDFNLREQARPKLSLQCVGAAPDELDVARLLEHALPQLGLGGALELCVQSLQLDGDGRAVARVAIAYRGHVTRNRGLLIFRADGSLMDWQTALPAGLSAAQAEALLERAEALGLGERGELSLGLRPGGFTVRATERRTPGRKAVVFTLEQPFGPALDAGSFAQLYPGGGLLTG